MFGLVRLGLLSRRGFGRVVPDPHVVGVVLTAIVLFSALTWGTPPSSEVSTVGQLLAAWSGGGGLWKLLAFTTQACLMLVLGSALADAPAMRRGIEWGAALAGSARQLVALTAFVSLALALINWSLGLIGGALLARAAGEAAQRRGWRLHYPILCAAGYSGLMIWHGGLSGSAPLKVTRAVDLVEVLGADLAGRVGPMPIESTLLSPLNIVVSGGLLVLGPLLFAALTPRGDEDPAPLSVPASAAQWMPNPDAATSVAEQQGGHATGGWLDRIERSPVITVLIAGPLSASLGWELVQHGVSRLDLNTINAALWAAGLWAHGTPDRFVASCERSIRGCLGVLLQFPLYAGVMGVMVTFGLSDRLTAVVANVGADLLPVVTFLSAGLVNLFVPSGGGQWAIQGPILVQAAPWMSGCRFRAWSWPWPTEISGRTCCSRFGHYRCSPSPGFGRATS